MPEGLLPPPLPSHADRDGDDATAILLGRNNLLQLVQLRWLAVGGQLATILGVQFGLGAQLPLAEMLALVAALSLFNLATWLRCRTAAGEIANGELFTGLLVDVVLLTALLYYSGGIANPFIFLYLLQVAVGAVLLKPRYIWAVVVLTTACFVWLTRWNQPLVLPELVGPTLSLHYMGGLMVCFVLNAALLVIFIHRISTNLRQRDARLADLRQRAAEEEHIVRMVQSGRPTGWIKAGGETFQLDGSSWVAERDRSPCSILSLKESTPDL
ncbi:MAG: hypothetical protein MUP33_07420 [Polaromonas sp.]|nr:hypothetical protein [Polaromonas sp.]